MSVTAAHSGAELQKPFSVGQIIPCIYPNSFSPVVIDRSFQMVNSLSSTGSSRRLLLLLLLLWHRTRLNWKESNLLAWRETKLPAARINMARVNEKQRELYELSRALSLPAVFISLSVASSSRLGIYSLLFRRELTRNCVIRAVFLLCFKTISPRRDIFIIMKYNCGERG